MKPSILITRSPPTTVPFTNPIPLRLTRKTDPPSIVSVTRKHQQQQNRFRCRIFAVHNDPVSWKKEDIGAIANLFVSAILPPGSEDLKGKEVETVNKFKNALGIDDPDAAAMHMEIGWRISRKKLKTSNLDADVEQLQLAALNRMRNIFCLGEHDESVILDVSSMLYCRRLSQAISSGDLEASQSKVVFFLDLCDELHFDLQMAIKIHEEIYWKKLQQAIADGKLSEEDVKALEGLQVVLCIPRETVEAVHEGICSSLFEKVVKDAIAAGVDGHDAEVKNSIRKAVHSLRLTREAAMSIASKVVRKIFETYIQRARATGSRIETAKVLTRMVAFNTLVVTELVADIKGDSLDSPPKVPTKEDERQRDEEEEWKSLQSLRKIISSKELSGKTSQTEITLKDDLPERDRTDLYKTYLLFLLTVEDTRIQFAGARITPDDYEYVLLNHLGGILGLTETQIMQVHRSLAEQASRKQAEVILADRRVIRNLLGNRGYV